MTNMLSLRLVNKKEKVLMKEFWRVKLYNCRMLFLFHKGGKVPKGKEDQRQSWGMKKNSKANLLL